MTIIHLGKSTCMRFKTSHFINEAYTLTRRDIVRTSQHLGRPFPLIRIDSDERSRPTGRGIDHHIGIVAHTLILKLWIHFLNYLIEKCPELGERSM